MVQVVNGANGGAVKVLKLGLRTYRYVQCAFNVAFVPENNKTVKVPTWP